MSDGRIQFPFHQHQAFISGNNSQKDKHARAGGGRLPAALTVTFAALPPGSNESLEPTLWHVFFYSSWNRKYLCQRVIGQEFLTNRFLYTSLV